MILTLEKFASNSMTYIGKYGGSVYMLQNRPSNT